MSAAGPSLRQALAGVSRRLQKAGIERPRAEARLLASEAMTLPIEAIVGHDERILTADESAALEAVTGRRERREPMAQILGRREFYGRPFRVTAGVLTPRPDSETLIDAVLARIDNRGRPLRILDLGVGSGCLLLTLLCELPAARGLGVDASAAALEIAGQNAQALGVSDRCDLAVGNWAASIGGKFDLVVSNPPYIPSSEIDRLEPEVARFEPRLALDGGGDGLACYRQLVVDLDRLLVAGGWVAVEIGQGQGDDVADLLRAAGLDVLERRPDLAGLERCVVARKP